MVYYRHVWTKGDLNINGKEYIVFQSTYAVPVDSDVAKKMQQGAGVVWHTSYEGDSVENMSATFDLIVVRRNTNVWFDDAIT